MCICQYSQVPPYGGILPSDRLSVPPVLKSCISLFECTKDWGKHSFYSQFQIVKLDILHMNILYNKLIMNDVLLLTKHTDLVFKARFRRKIDGKPLFFSESELNVNALIVNMLLFLNQVDERTGRMTGTYRTYAISGAIRRMVCTYKKYLLLIMLFLSVAKCDKFSQREKKIPNS